MKLKLAFIIALFSIFLTLTCEYFNLKTNQQWINNSNNNNTDVYITGHFVSGTNTYACYWKNNIFTQLENNPSNSFSIDVINKDIYISGSYNAYPSNNACFWKNGQRTDLSGQVPARAISIKVNNGIVYTCGYNNFTETSEEEPTAANACYWVNDRLYQLELISGTSLSVANAIFVDENLNIFISGYYELSATGTTNYACYWLNGQIINLAGHIATSIFTNNGNLYIAGRNASGPCYWINGNVNNLNSSSNLVKILSQKLYNGDIYSIGYYSATTPPPYEATFWKNSDLLVDNTTNYVINFNSIFIFNGNVYICGVSNSNACYWLNLSDINNSIILPGVPSGSTSIARSILVAYGN